MNNSTEGRETKQGFTTPIEDIAGAGRDYLNLKIDAAKLAATEGLSVVLGRFLSAMLIVTFLGITMSVCFIFGVFLLGEILGSYALASGILAAGYLLITIILIACRKKLFVNTFVRILTAILFSNETDK